MKIIRLLPFILMLFTFMIPVHAAQPGVTYRFVNLVTSQTVDLYRNEEVVFFENNLGTLSAERVIESGTHTFAIYAHNETPGSAFPLAEITLDFTENTSFLLIAAEQNGQIILTTHTYDLTPVPANRARLEVVNLVDYMPDLSIMGQNQDVLVEGAVPGTTTTADVPGGVYQITMQDTATFENLAAGTINTIPGNLVTLIAYGNDEIRLVTLEHPLEQKALFRLFHAGRISPFLDVYFDNALIFSGIGYAESTPYTVFEPGNYAVEIYEAGGIPGTNTPLWAGSVQLSVNAPITGVALGESMLRLVVNQDDHLLIPENRARIRFINAALNLLQLTVRDSGTEPLVGGLEYVLGSRNQNIEPGTRTLTFRETGGADYVTLEAFSFEANHFYTFIVVGNALIDGSVEAIPLDWNWKLDPIED